MIISFTKCDLHLNKCQKWNIIVGFEILKSTERNLQVDISISCLLNAFFFDFFLN